MIWRLKQRPASPPMPSPLKVEVFVRHCTFSSISQHKQRFPHFTREACHRNLTETLDHESANLTCFLDRGREGSHFLEKETRFPIVEIKEGSEAGSFLRLLDYIEGLHLHPDTLLYLVEDDYLHRSGWLSILKEGFEIPGVDYVTLYDHRDKYTPLYSKLQSKLFVTANAHWRTIPSTTQTFAVRWKTLQRDLPIHRKFSRGRKISEDHRKFSFLTKRRGMLVSPLPGWSTHAEPPFASPLVDWQEMFNPL